MFFNTKHVGILIILGITCVKSNPLTNTNAQLKCWDSHGWQEPDYEPQFNYTSCPIGNCFGVKGLVPDGKCYTAIPYRFFKPFIDSLQFFVDIIGIHLFKIFVWLLFYTNSFGQ